MSERTGTICQNTIWDKCQFANQIEANINLQFDKHWVIVSIINYDDKVYLFRVRKVQNSISGQFILDIIEFCRIGIQLFMGNLCT